MATSPISSDLGRDPGLTCLLILARWFERAVDGARLQQEFAEGGAPLDDARLVRAARWIGLRARRRSTNLDHLARIPLPAIVGWENDSYAILLGVRGDDLLLQHPLHGAPQRLSRQAFEAQWNSTVIQIGRRGTAATGTQQRHGFAWLLPFVLRYRRQLLEVLSASFVIQLLGLVSPLFFQVVIDKVLAHSGLTTLDVLALGLLLVSVFEVILGGLRSYVLAHTTNRIDVALGAVLFRHLVSEAGVDIETLNVADVEARSETDVGLAVIEGRADAGLGVRAVAHQLGLDFVPLHRERYDLLIRRRDYFENAIQQLMRFIESDTFKERAAVIEGYDVSHVGRIHFNAP